MAGADKLRSALSLLGASVSVLPATGGAVEYLQRPDADELDDLTSNAEVTRVDEFAETRAPARATVNIPVPALHREEKHLYRYFIDGSLRTYFLGTGIEHNRNFPILLAQIGASCIHRLPDGSLTLFSHRTRILLILPKGGSGLSDAVWAELEKLNAPDRSFSVENSAQDAAGGGHREIDPRTRAGGIARNRMHLLEVDQIDHSDSQRSPDTWCILDGAVKLDRFIEKRHLIGVAKSFSKQPTFSLGSGVRALDVTALLANLEYAHRTPAFASHGGKVAFWYVRLWPYKELDYPLMGIVKVELPTPDTQPADSDVINELSRCLVGERSVTPYGSDIRWHCHLYPIFCAEKAIKEQFMTQEVMLGHVKWNLPAVTP